MKYYTGIALRKYFYGYKILSPTPIEDNTFYYILKTDLKNKEINCRSIPLYMGCQLFNIFDSRRNKFNTEIKNFSYYRIVNSKLIGWSEDGLPINKWHIEEVEVALR